jgi:lysozyme family protein
MKETGRPYILINPDERDYLELTVQQLVNALENLANSFKSQRSGLETDYIWTGSDEYVDAARALVAKYKVNPQPEKP